MGNSDPELELTPEFGVVSSGVGVDLDRVFFIEDGVGVELGSHTNMLGVELELTSRNGFGVGVELIFVPFCQLRFNSDIYIHCRTLFQPRSRRR